MSGALLAFFWSVFVLIGALGAFAFVLGLKQS